MPRIKVDLPETFPFKTDLPIRITDINYGNHLGNNMLLALLHEARVQFFNQYGWTEHDIEGAGIIMTDAAVRFTGTGHYGQVLSIEVGAANLGRKGCDLFYRVTDRESGKPIAEAKTGIAFYDYERGRLLATPEGFRAQFSKPA